MCTIDPNPNQHHHSHAIPSPPPHVSPFNFLAKALLQQHRWLCKPTRSSKRICPWNILCSIHPRRLAVTFTPLALGACGACGGGSASPLGLGTGLSRKLTGIYVLPILQPAPLLPTSGPPPTIPDFRGTVPPPKLTLRRIHVNYATTGNYRQPSIPQSLCQSLSSLDPVSIRQAPDTLVCTSK